MNLSSRSNSKCVTAKFDGVGCTKSYTKGEFILGVDRIILSGIVGVRLNKQKKRTEKLWQSKSLHSKCTGIHGTVIRPASN
jgi:hypothetical protein